MKNPVAKEVRTPKYKSQVIDNKKIYNRKKIQNKEHGEDISYENKGRKK
jgi:hypothetical protein